MAKQGMNLLDDTKLHPKNEAGMEVPWQKSRHTSPYAQFDNDLAIENLLGDVPPEDR